jgi:hypothetical protein
MHAATVHAKSPFRFPSILSSVAASVALRAFEAMFLARRPIVISDSLRLLRRLMIPALIAVHTLPIYSSDSRAVSAPLLTTARRSRVSPDRFTPIPTRHRRSAAVDGRMKPIAIRTADPKAGGREYGPRWPCLDQILVKAECPPVMIDPKGGGRPTTAEPRLLCSCVAECPLEIRTSRGQ